MTAPSDELMRMAREVAAENYPFHVRTYKSVLSGDYDDFPIVKAIYAALQSTAEKARAEERERYREVLESIKLWHEGTLHDLEAKGPREGETYTSHRLTIEHHRRVISQIAAIMAEKETGQ